MCIAQCRLVISTVLLTITGCTGSNTSSSGADKTDSNPALSGSAVLGPVANGSISAFAFNSDGSRGSQLGQTTTDTNGIYSLNIPPQSGPVGLELNSGSYLEESNGISVSISSKQALHAVLPSVAAGGVKAAITPLTEIAYQSFLSSVSASIASGASLTVLAQWVNTSVSSASGLPDILTIQPALITSSSVLPNTYAGQYARLLAGFSEQALSTGANSVQLAIAYATDFVQNNGSFSTQSQAVIDSVTVRASWTGLPSQIQTFDTQSGIPSSYPLPAIVNPTRGQLSNLPPPNFQAPAPANPDTSLGTAMTSPPQIPWMASVGGSCPAAPACPPDVPQGILPSGVPYCLTQAGSCNGGTQGIFGAAGCVQYYAPFYNSANLPQICASSGATYSPLPCALSNVAGICSSYSSQRQGRLPYKVSFFYGQIPPTPPNTPDDVVHYCQVAGDGGGVWEAPPSSCPVPPTINPSQIDLSFLGSGSVALFKWQSVLTDSEIILKIAKQIDSIMGFTFPASCADEADQMQAELVKYFTNPPGNKILNSKGWVILTQGRNWGTSPFFPSADPFGPSIMGGPHTRAFAWNPTNPSSNIVVIDPWTEHLPLGLGTGSGYYEVAPSAFRSPFNDTGDWSFYANQTLGVSSLASKPNSDARITDSNGKLTSNYPNPIPGCQ